MYSSQTTDIVSVLVKIFRVFCIYFILSAAVKIQEREYIVYSVKTPLTPPSFRIMIWTVFGGMVATSVFIFSVVYTMASMGLVMPHIIGQSLTDSISFTAFVSTFTYYVCRLMRTKRYMDYRNNGLKSLRAFRKILMWFIIPFSLSPAMFV